MLSENRNQTERHSHEHDIDDAVNQHYAATDFTWEQMIRDCGAHVMIENSARANEIFNRQYLKKVVTWKGYFLNAFLHSLSPMGFNPEHMVNINIRMIPSESLKNPDLFLSLDNSKFNAYNSVLRTLKTGDPIKFTATLEAVGNEWRTHHLHMLKIEKTEDFIDHEKKVVLFHGINFNITGHLQMESELKEIQEKVADLKIVVTDVHEDVVKPTVNETEKNETVVTNLNSNKSLEIETPGDKKEEIK